MYWGDVFTSPLFFINFPAYKNYTLTHPVKNILLNNIFSNNLSVLLNSFILQMQKRAYALFYYLNFNYL